MIKYIGSKRVLVPALVDVVRSFPEVRSVVDFFSGTSRVGHALKREGYRVLANDWLPYARTLATCYVQAEASHLRSRAEELVAHLDGLPGREGYFTETFCRRSRFLQARNGARVDAIRDEIEALDLEPELRAVALVSLMEAADRVDSTTGLQMAYLKEWAPRSFNELRLRVPELLDGGPHGPCEAHGLEAQEAAVALEADLAYVDPPYNQHSYLGNYHVWETLVRWDRPEVYGVACKRVDCRTRRSDFNSKRKFHGAFASFVGRLRCRFLVVSFSDEGFLGRAELEELLRSRGDVHVLERDHKRYVGAQIGIHDPQGRKVGAVSHLRNKEFVFVVVPAGYEWSPDAVGEPPGASAGASGAGRREGGPKSAAR